MPVAAAFVLAVAVAGYPGPWRLDPPDNGDELLSVAFAPDGRTVVAGTRSGTVVRWHPDTGRPTEVRVADADVFALDLCPLGRWAIVQTTDRSGARLHDAGTGKRIAAVPTPVADADHLLPAFSADGRRMAVGFVRGHGSPTPGPARVAVWDFAANKAVGTVELPIPPGGIVTQRVALSADGTRLAAVIEAGEGSDVPDAGVWDVATGRRTATFPGSTQHHPTGPAAVSNDGGTVVFASRRGTMVWRPTWEYVRHSARESQVTPLVVRPAGRSFLAVVAGRAYPQLAVYESVTLAERTRLPWDEVGSIRAAAVTPDDRTIAVVTRRHVWTYRLPPARRDTPPAKLWDGLTGSANSSAFAIRELAERPADALALFRAKLAPVPVTPPLDVPATIAKLDAPQYAVREDASHKLRAVARFVLPQLRAAHAATGSAERRERLSGLIASAGEYSPDELRHVRAAEILETVATADAYDLLTRLATGAPDAILTRESAAALARRRP